MREFEERYRPGYMDQNEGHILSLWQNEKAEGCYLCGWGIRLAKQRIHMVASGLKYITGYVAGLSRIVNVRVELVSTYENLCNEVAMQNSALQV